MKTMEEQEYEHASSLRTDDYPATAGFYLLNRLDYVRALLLEGDDMDREHIAVLEATPVAGG